MKNIRIKKRSDYINDYTTMKTLKAKTEELMSVLSVGDWKYKSIYIYTLMTNLASIKMLMTELRKHIDEFDRRNVMNDASIDILIQKTLKDINKKADIIAIMTQKEAEESF